MIRTRVSDDVRNWIRHSTMHCRRLRIVRRMLRWMLPCLLAVSAAACSKKEPATYTPLPRKAPLKACVSESFLDVAYAKDKRTQLDIYLPVHPRQRPVPWVLWVHGGGWAGGSRESVDPFAIKQACRGYAVVTVDYRLSFEAKFPAALADVRAALRYVRAHAFEYELDPTNVVVWGASAGGHLVSMLGLTPDHKSFDRPDDPHRKQPVTVRGVIAWWTPTSFPEFDADFGTTCPQRSCHTCINSPESRLIGCEVKKCVSRARKASPITYVHDKAPPFLIQHGSDDCTVPVAQSQRLAEALKNVGATADLRIIPGGRHGDGTWLRADVLAAVDGFLDRHLHNPSLSKLPAFKPLSESAATSDTLVR